MVKLITLFVLVTLLIESNPQAREDHLPLAIIAGKACLAQDVSKGCASSVSVRCVEQDGSVICYRIQPAWDTDQGQPTSLPLYSYDSLAIGQPFILKTKVCTAWQGAICVNKKSCDLFW
jgi:hypothetical protein